MPDIEAMELVERYFDLGAGVAGTGHPVAIFLAGCRECLAEWEVQVAHVPASYARSERVDLSDAATSVPEAAAPSIAESRSPGSSQGFCPSGQNGTTENGGTSLADEIDLIRMLESRLDVIGIGLRGLMALPSGRSSGVVPDQSHGMCPTPALSLASGRPDLVRLLRMKVREVIRMVEQDGWVLGVPRGSHRQFKHPRKSGRVTVSGGFGDDMPKGTLPRSGVRLASNEGRHEQGPVSRAH